MKHLSIKLKRVYEPVEPADGRRILVERLWPRGIKKADLKIDLWLKDIAPSNELRKFYSHDPGRWEDFKIRYCKEMDSNMNEVSRLIGEISSAEIVTFLFSSRETRLNSASVLKEFVEKKIREGFPP